MTSIQPILKLNSTSFMFNNIFCEMNIKKSYPLWEWGNLPNFLLEVWLVFTWIPNLKRGHWPLLLVLALKVLFITDFAWEILFDLSYWYWESMPYEPIAINERCPSLPAVLVLLYQRFLIVAVAVWSDILLLTYAHRGESNNNQEKVLIMC